MNIFVKVAYFYFILHIGKFEPIYEINEKYHNPHIRYGDILLKSDELPDVMSSKPRGAVVRESGNNRWKFNIIPYMLSQRFSETQKTKITNALKQLEQQSCFKFVPRRGQYDYVDIHPLDGCYSYVGKVGGPQLLSLGDGCLYNFIIWHEMMHAIGIEHEHQRPDRDQYIKIIYANIEQGQMVNFEKISFDEVDIHDIPYDYKSIMHYDGAAFGRYNYMTGHRLVTMVPLKSGVTLLDNFELTQNDIEKLNIIGKCNRTNVPLSPIPFCEDKSLECPAYKANGFCHNRFYRAKAKEICEFTCGLCEKKEKLLDEKIIKKRCIDQANNCAAYTTLGFCTNELYRHRAKMNCAKTCNLCD